MNDRQNGGADLRARAEQFRAAHPQRAVQAPDPGKVLAEAPRSDGTVFRVTLHEYQGRPFVRVGPWAPGEGGAWPVKGKGCAVKVRELAALAEGVAAAMDAIDAMGQPPPGARR